MFRDAGMENNHLAVVRRSLWLPNLQMMYGLASFSQDYPVKQKEVLTCLLDNIYIYIFFYFKLSLPFETAFPFSCLRSAFCLMLKCVVGGDGGLRAEKYQRVHNPFGHGLTVGSEGKV